MNEYAISEATFRGHTPFRYDPQGSHPEWLQRAIRDADDWAKRILPIMWLSILALAANNDPAAGLVDDHCFDQWMTDHPQHAQELAFCLSTFVDRGALALRDGGFSVTNWNELYRPSSFIIEIADLHKSSPWGTH